MNFVTGITCFVFLLTKLYVVSCDKDKPTGMKQGIYCECCSATVKEISNRLEKKTSDPWEVKVVEAMENICKASSFRSYDYSPPTTVKACNFLLENYDEDIEQVFISKELDPEKKICYEISKACEGVDRTKKEKEDMDVRVNDEKQEVKKPDDGIQRLNVDINDPSSASKLAEQIKEQIAMQQAEGGATDYDEDDEEEAEEMPEDMEEDGDGDEGNERSVKKPKTDEEEGKTADKEEKPEGNEETASTNQKTEL